MKKLITLLGALSLVGCATPYQQMGSEGGFQSQRLSANMFAVQFLGNGFTSQKQADGFAFLRAAEITQQIGYRYFMILKDVNQTSVDYAQFTTPGYTHGNVNVIGNFAYLNATTTAPTVHNIPVLKPGREFLVRCYDTIPPHEDRLTGVDYMGTHRGTVYEATELAARIRAEFKLKG